MISASVSSFPPECGGTCGEPEREGIAALEAFGRTPIVSWHLAVPPHEVYRWFFAGAFRSWAYPRSLYLAALAHHRLGQEREAREALQHLLAIWSQADRDLPLLAEARKLRASLGATPRDAR